MKNWRKSRGLFLSSVATGAMLNPLNSSMIALAIPNIQKDFGLSYLKVSWLISSLYSLWQLLVVVLLGEILRIKPESAKA